MKKTITLIAAVLLTFTLWAQSPEKMSYQAVVRNAKGELISTKIGMKLSIMQGADATCATEVYTEILTPTPNINGLVSTQFGGGTGWNAIDWANGPYFIKTETDPTGGTNYTITGVSQLLSVPYALYAKTAEIVKGGITETDPFYVAGQAVNIIANDITNLRNLSGTNTGDQDIRGIAINLQAIKDTATQIRSEIPDVSGFISTETQSLADVAAINNSVNSQLKNLMDPTDAQDAATKACVDELKTQIEELKIATGIIAKDADGNIYKTVYIGPQRWMAENLKTTRYNDGTYIPLITENTAWGNLITPGYCWYGNDSATYAQTYGALYNWYTVETGKLCPIGWHEPTDAEWTELIDYFIAEGYTGTVGLPGNIGTALKATSGWNNSGNGTDDYGFTALPGALRDANGTYGNVGESGSWWSTSEAGTNLDAWGWVIFDISSYFFQMTLDKKRGYSVRCLRD